MLSLFVIICGSLAVHKGIATGSFESMPLKGPRSLGAIVANLFMLQGLAAGQLSANYPALSISTEFIAYLALQARRVSAGFTTDQSQPDSVSRALVPSNDQIFP